MVRTLHCWRTSSEKMVSVGKHRQESEKPGGCLKGCLAFWSELTKDRIILDLIQGVKLDIACMPKQSIQPIMVSDMILEGLLNEVLDSDVIENTHLGEQGEFVSRLMKRPKWNGGWRIILNLKSLNEQSSTHYHFKLKTLQDILDIVTPSSFMATVDLTQAFHAISLHPNY